MAVKNILVVDDEVKILDVTASYLESRGYHTFRAEDGQQALEIFHKENISLVILDLMLPDLSGEEVCVQIRKQSRVPVIMLTAKAHEKDMLNGLGIGADDYMKKPFSLKELAARAEAVLRRASDDLIPLYTRNSFNQGDLTVDFEQNIIRKKEQIINLTPSERNILAVLIKYPGKVFTRAELIEAALGGDFYGFDRSVDSHIKNLRHKIEDNPKAPVYVVTIHGKGYKFGGK